MGTRNLTCVYLDGEYKVAQYGQWDGYPSGTGVDVLEFVRDKMNRIVFEKKLRAINVLTEHEVQKKWQSVGADDSGLVNMEISNFFQKTNPQLHRDCGADVLNMIQEATEGFEIKKELEFAADSLFCEWCYVIDLDRNTLEAYEGFNKTPLGDYERFKFLEELCREEYQPVKLKGLWSFNLLPTNDEFIADLETEEDDLELSNSKV